MSVSSTIETIEISLDVLQMGVFTELSVLYSKYRPEKRKYMHTLVFQLATYLMVSYGTS